MKEHEEGGVPVCTRVNQKWGCYTKLHLMCEWKVKDELR